MFAGTTINITEMLEHLKHVANTQKLPFGVRENTYNSRLAQELGLWAQAGGRGNDFHMAAFHAYFADGKNLAHKDVLMEIVDKLDLDRGEAAKVLNERTHRAELDRDWEMSRKLAITAVPTFVFGGQKLTGAQPFADIVRFLHRVDPGLAEKR